ARGGVRGERDGAGHASQIPVFGCLTTHIRMASEGRFFGWRSRKGPEGQQTRRRDRYLHWVKTQDIGRINRSDTQDSQSTDVFHGFSLFEMAKNYRNAPSVP